MVEVRLWNQEIADWRFAMERGGDCAPLTLRAVGQDHALVVNLGKDATAETARRGAAKAVKALRERYGIRPEEVERVLVDLQMDKPTYRYRLPKTDLEARYSLSYGIALALLDGELTLRQYAEDRITRADSVEMMERIVDTPASGAGQQTVVLLLRDGRRYDCGFPLY